MNKLIGLISLALVACFVCSGCAQYGVSVVGSTLPITERDAYTTIGRASGSDWALGIIGFQIWPTSAYTALQKAKAVQGADGLINVTAENKIYYILPVFTVFTVHVIQIEGDAIRFERKGS